MTPQHQAPHDYPRRVLLAVAGLSPQIVTETLYALAVRGEPRFMPTEVHLITTTKGAERAELSLLSRGWFQRLLDDYGLPPIAFELGHIEIVHDGDGNPLVDIRTAADNECVADHLTDRIRRITSERDSALHVSMAGGRKTMGYFAGYALSLFGRSQDRLSHVLVSEPFESSWDFFYPTQYSRVITLKDNELADTRHAQVTLADIPFVRLREGLPQPLLQGRVGFTQAIAVAQRAQQPPELIIDLRGRRIQAGGQVVEMSPANLAFYAVFARRLGNRLAAARHDTEGFTAQYIDELRRISGPDSGTVVRAEERTYANGMDEDQFQVLKTRVNGALRTQLGPQLAAAYLIDDDGGERPHTRYRLNLPAEALAFGSIATADRPFFSEDSARRMT
ncbi:CRISPR-associated ring nuclease Csm6 [Thiohalocapsa sp. ML1]|uniref:CRISPR-associated ring nuclease Csm6 n=1 Tax=Thiohalocapsa sp. ML1 TaxID=1431688 RepID=UPI000732380F|nr:CRISPR-associated ring nuclease Csm6 [Thiohalocapsa sp. ML1]